MDELSEYDQTDLFGSFLPKSCEDSYSLAVGIVDYRNSGNCEKLFLEDGFRILKVAFTSEEAMFFKQEENEDDTGEEWTKLEIAIKQLREFALASIDAVKVLDVVCVYLQKEKNATRDDSLRILHLLTSELNVVVI